MNINLDKDKVEQWVHWGLIIILAAVIIYAVWPFEIFKSSRNATRRSHMETVMSAIYSHAVDHVGFYPECIPDYNEGAVELNVCADELSKDIRGRFPEDPDPEHSYMIERVDERERFRIFSTAPEAEGVEVIQ